MPAPSPNGGGGVFGPISPCEQLFVVVVMVVMRMMVSLLRLNNVTSLLPLGDSGLPLHACHESDEVLVVVVVVLVVVVVVVVIHQKEGEEMLTIVMCVMY